jgi:hypothetical protein
LFFGYEKTPRRSFFGRREIQKKPPKTVVGPSQGGEEKELNHPKVVTPHRCLSSSLIWAKVTIVEATFSEDGVPSKGGT